MATGGIEKSFLNDGFKVTYYDGVVERFHKNLLDDNYKGDKGSTIVNHLLDEGFTVNKFDGTREKFQWKNSKEFLSGDKGTRIREGFWGDYFISENPYAGYNPPTISDARKAKYQETPVRAYVIDKNSSTTLEELKNDLQDIIDASGLQIHLSDATKDGNPIVAIVCNTNSSYMPVCCYFTSENGECYIAGTVSGKGYQVNAADLSKMYYKAASPWGKLQIKASRGGAMATYFGYSVRSGGAIGGIGALAGLAIGGGIKLAAKGIKVLLRDNDAYKSEMDFYNKAAGIIDYAIGYNDSFGISELIRTRADAGLPIAQYQMGIAYVYGIGVEANENDAFRWFEKAAERGELRSQNIVAGEYLYNKEKAYSIEQKKQGVYYLYNLASFGEDWAGELLIDIFGRHSVEGIDSDLDEAIRVAEILADEDNLHALYYLAETYSGTSSNGASFLNKEKAFACYAKILQVDSSNKESISMLLASMCDEGIGTPKNHAEAIRYYEIAASCGNNEAKAKLLEAYTYGKDVERSKTKVKSLSKDLMRSKDEKYIAYAKYMLFADADIENEYGKALKHAREYLSGNYQDTLVAQSLNKYISEIEERISVMSEEERREFLKEPKKLSVDSELIKRIAIIAAVALLIIGGVFLVHGVLGDRSSELDEKSDLGTPETITVPDEALPAMEAYNNFLSQDSINVGNDEVPLYWDSENCQFNIGFIDADEIPELIVCNYTDAGHADGYCRIFSTYDGSDIFEYGRVSDPESELANDRLGYFEKSAYYTDFSMYQGYASYTIQNPYGGGGAFRKEYFDNDGTEEDVAFYIIGDTTGEQECSESDFYDAIEERFGDNEFIPYTFYDNNRENREALLGVEELDNDQENASDKAGTMINSEDEAVDYIINLTGFQEGGSSDFENVKIGSEEFDGEYYPVRIYNDMEDHISTLGYYGVTEDGYVYDLISDEWIVNEEGQVRPF